MTLLSELHIPPVEPPQELAYVENLQVQTAVSDLFGTIYPHFKLSKDWSTAAGTSINFTVKDIVVQWNQRSSYSGVFTPDAPRQWDGSLEVRDESASNQATLRLRSDPSAVNTIDSSEFEISIMEPRVRMLTEAILHLVVKCDTYDLIRATYSSLHKGWVVTKVINATMPDGLLEENGGRQYIQEHNPDVLEQDLLNDAADLVLAVRDALISPERRLDQ